MGEKRVLLGVSWVACRSWGLNWVYFCFESSTSCSVETSGYVLILFLRRNSSCICVFRGWAERFMNRLGFEGLLGGLRAYLEQFVARGGLGSLPDRIHNRQSWC